MTSVEAPILHADFPVHSMEWAHSCVRIPLRVSATHTHPRSVERRAVSIDFAKIVGPLGNTLIDVFFGTLQGLMTMSA